MAPSTNQSLFTTVQNLVTALQSSGNPSATGLSNAIDQSINNIDQALAPNSDVRASIGGRLNSITTQQSVASSQQTQLQTPSHRCRVWTTRRPSPQLDQQNTTLSAALQAYTLTQGLSLFKFL